MAQISNDNILFDAQTQTCEILNADSDLSAIHFIPENLKAIDTEIQTALRRQGICGVVMTPKATFIGKHSTSELTWELGVDVLITENVLINRAKPTAITGQDAAMKALDVLGQENYGMFSPVSYEQGEDNGLLVNKASLKCYIHK